MLRWAICNELYRDWPVARTMAHANASGYQGVEIAPHTLGTGDERFSQRTIRDWRQAAADHGLSIVGLHWLLAQTEGLHWTSSDRATRGKTGDYLAKLVDLCSDLGGKVMVLGSPRQRDLAAGVSPTQGTEYAADVLERIQDKLAERQIVLAIEPLGAEETNFLNTADQVAEFIRRVNTPWVRLHLDVKAMSSELHPIPEIIAKHRHDLAHFHANDPNRRGPGMGRVDFVPILKALIDVNYPGWVSVEAFDDSPGIEATARESIDNLRRDYSKALAL